ncbi:MAG: DUF302 domain-containing protein [Alphaproteobacteria bacterium]
MSYYFSTTVSGDFNKVLGRVVAALQEQGFGIITEIDVKETLRKKLDVAFRNYKILGACNPRFAYEALQIEDKVGTMLPCNVVVQESADGQIEVAAIDPAASMQAIDNPKLKEVAATVGEKLKKVIAAIGRSGEI